MMLCSSFAVTEQILFLHDFVILTYRPTLYMNTYSRLVLVHAYQLATEHLQYSVDRWSRPLGVKLLVSHYVSTCTAKNQDFTVSTCLIR